MNPDHHATMDGSSRPRDPLGPETTRLRQALLEATTNSAFLIDADGFFLAVNEIGARRLGARPAEMIGGNARHFVPWEVFERRMAVAHDVICTRRPIRFEDQRQGICFDNLFSPIFDETGEVACVAMFAEVITNVKAAEASLQQAYDEMENQVYERILELREANEALKREIGQRVEAETALRASERRFRQLADNIEDVFWLTDPGPPVRVLYVSPAFETIWGYPAEEIYADPDLWLKSAHPEDREELAQTFATFMRDGKDFKVEFRILRPDGSIRWILDRGVPVLDDKGRLQRLAGIAQDITARKRVERHREDLVEELQQFAYVISHDLRAPLINLKGFSGEIRLALESITPLLASCGDTLTGEDRRTLALAIHEDLPEALGFIETSVTRMEGMINAILKLSRTAQRRTSPERLDMVQVVTEVLDSLAFQIQQSGATVRVGDLPAVTADRIDMQQVFANLIGNAVKYLDPDRPGDIVIDGRPLFDEVRFEVRDNGIGVPADQADRIFDLFQRLESGAAPGEGIGLACVRSVIRRYGGRIWCETGREPGTAFRFTMPVAPDPIQKGEPDDVP